MKIDALYAHQQPPIQMFEVDGLSNLVVLAGPNGVGKTRLITSLLNSLRNPGNVPHYILSATCESERDVWGGKAVLDSRASTDAPLIRQTLQRPQQRGRWRSSVFHIDAARQVSQVQPIQWSWQFLDPVTEMLGWDSTFNLFRERYTDTIQALYRALAHHRQEIARKAIELQRSGEAAMPLDFPDPLQRFKEAFRLLLAPKELADIDLNNPRLRFISDGQVLEIDALSSGEKEVFAIVFDLLLREPEDCIIMFDEPELHLHPELAFRFLRTLATIGHRNQFILCTHSADIISAAIENSVVFLRPADAGKNQALLLRPGDDQVVALRELGQSLGVISLGRKIVLIEGEQSSLDRDTYGAITQARFPEFALVPAGSQGALISFGRVITEVLDRALWGIDFFMLTDRDSTLSDAAVADLEQRSGGRLRFIRRCHLENYFLDEQTIAIAFQDLVQAGDWRRDPAAIRDRLEAEAEKYIPVAVNLWLGTLLRSAIGEVDVSVKAVVDKTESEFLRDLIPRLNVERARIDAALDPIAVEASVRTRWRELTDALTNPQEGWKRLFPGKVLLARFCSVAQIDKGYFRNLYIAAARRQNLAPFADIIAIFEGWKT